MKYEINRTHQVDCLSALRQLPSDSIDCIVTSPPYNKKGLQGKKSQNKASNKTDSRYKYHEKGNQIWSKFEIDYKVYDDCMPEEEYEAWMVEVINEMVRVIKPAGSIFFNHKPRRHKNRAHLPTNFIDKTDAIIYQVIIWNRRSSPNIRNDVLVPCVEYIYLLTKEKPKVFRKSMDPEYKTEVWNITPLRQANHPAPFPPKLVENCINLSTVEGDIGLDPFMGSGTTARAAQNLNREWLGFEIDPSYIENI